MSKIFNCPVCGETTCVADYMGLNYCAYCGNSVNGEWHYAYRQQDNKTEIPSKKVEIKQINLFAIEEYKKPQAWNGG